MVQGDLIYPKATSRIIIMTKPTISPRVPTSVLPLVCESGINSSTTTKIIAPAAKPIMMSSNFRLMCLKKKTMADPTMVQTHVNNPARKACKTTDYDWNQFITTPIFLLIHWFYSTIFSRMKEDLSKKREWDRNPRLSIIFGLSSKTQWLSAQSTALRWRIELAKQVS